MGLWKENTKKRAMEICFCETKEQYMISKDILVNPYIV